MNRCCKLEVELAELVVRNFLHPELGVVVVPAHAVPHRLHGEVVTEVARVR